MSPEDAPPNSNTSRDGTRLERLDAVYVVSQLSQVSQLPTAVPLGQC